MEEFLQEKGDFLGILTSGLCVIHCSVLPILLAFGFAQGVVWMHSLAVELVFIALGMSFAYFALYKGYKHIHGNSKPLMIASLGFCCFFIGITLGHNAEILFTSLGGIMIVSSHFSNWKLLRASA